MSCQPLAVIQKTPIATIKATDNVVLRDVDVVDCTDGRTSIYDWHAVDWASVCAKVGHFEVARLAVMDEIHEIVVGECPRRAADFAAILEYTLVAVICLAVDALQSVKIYMLTRPDDVGFCHELATMTGDLARETHLLQKITSVSKKGDSEMTETVFWQGHPTRLF